MGKGFAIDSKEYRSRRAGMRFAALVAFAAATCTASADCLDELLPRPRSVVRGAAAPHEVPEVPGGYRLVVRGGKPSFAGDGQGRRYARASSELKA